MIKAYSRSKFDYTAPLSLDAALKALRRDAGAAIIAGGTDLLPRWRAGLARPNLLIDLRLLGLSYIKIETDYVCIGACTTHSQMIASNQLAEKFPVLIEACRQIAASPVRNRGTLGGNLVNASPAADTAPPLLVYDAELVLVKDGSRRILPLEEFFIEPGQTIMEPDEILTEVRIPILQSNMASKFLKLGNRQAMAVAVASVAVRISLGEKEKVSDARIALGSVAPIPLRARKAEAMLVGGLLSYENISTAASIAQEEASPISDLRASREFRSKMVKVLVKRALKATRDEFGRRKS